MSKKEEKGVKEVSVTCQRCGWLLLANPDDKQTFCPMCGTQLQIGEKTLVKILAEYIDRQGLYVDDEEAENFIKSYKKNYKKLPTLMELWNASIQYAKIQDMSKKELKEFEKKQREKEEKQAMEIKAQMLKIKEQKKQQLEEEKRKKEEEERKKKEEEEKKKAAKEKAKFLICSECGEKNPLDSKFCLECGAKLEPT